MKYINSLIVFLCFLSCIVLAEPSEDNIYNDEFRVAKEEVVVVFPIDSDIQGVVEGSEVVLEELSKQLSGLGLKVISFSDNKDYKDLLAKVFGKSFLADLVANEAALSESLLFSTNFRFKINRGYLKDPKMYSYLNNKYFASYVIYPSLVMKKVKYKRSRAAWDGVKVKQKVKGAGARSYEWSGTTQGISLELDVYTIGKDWLFTSYGGLTLPFYVDLKDSEMKLVDDLYGKGRDIKKGVQVALYPIKDNMMD